ncbi:MAG: CdaR family protein, partial [Candidatus Limnocylindrales bacterium]
EKGEGKKGGKQGPGQGKVQALSGRSQGTDWFPRTINVRLDPVTTRIVPVTVDHGTIPAGLVVADPETDVGTATVRGASSLVARVREARAQVSLDPNGINVDADVNLIPVDERGEVVAPVDIEPQIVHVRVEIGRENPTRPIPVVAQLVGDPASGYRVIAIEVTPLTVTVQGDPGLLGDLQSVTTEPVGVGGRTDDLDTDVELLLPEGVVVVDDPTVRVRVDLEPERGSRSFETGLTLTGAEPDRIYRLSTPAVVVTLGGTGAALQALDAATLSATVDVRRLDEGTDTVPIEFEPPEGTTLVAISPEEVGIVIEEAPRPSAEPQGSSLPGLPVLPSPAQ